MKQIAAFALLALLTACASNDTYNPPPRRGRPAGADDGGRTVADRVTPGGLEMMPPADWWRLPQIAQAVNLSADQYSKLDTIATSQGEEIARLARDSMVAVRDLRQVLDSGQPASSDIVAAGQRLRSMRDTLFDRQLRMLADERAVLTQQQWQTLQDQLQERRSQRNMDNNYPRGGRRGGMGGRGRWPGF